MPLSLSGFWAPKQRCTALGKPLATASATSLQTLYIQAKKVFADGSAAVAEQDIEGLKQLLGGCWFAAAVCHLPALQS